MLVGVLLTLGIGFGFCVSGWNSFKSDKLPKMRPWFSLKVDTASTPKYEFYDLLKQQQVSGVPEETALASHVDVNQCGTGCDCHCTTINRQCANDSN